MNVFGKRGNNANLSESIGLNNLGNQFWNLTPSELIGDTIINGQGMLTESGAIAIETPSADSLTVTGDLTVDTSTLKVDSTNNRVGIGTTSPDHTLTVSAAASPTLEIEHTGGPYKTNIVLNGNDTEFRGSSGNIEFYTGNNDGASSTERMRINASGHVIIGEANLLAGGSSYTNDGITIKAGSDTIFNRDGGSVADFSRQTSDGQVVRLSLIHI